LSVGVAYVSTNTHFEFNSLNNIFKDYSPIVLGGDFNAKHRSWNNFSNNNTRGIQGGPF